MNAIEQHALATAVAQRIEDLILYRSWFRSTAAAMHIRIAFADFEREYTLELRALLRIRRAARNIARAAQVEQDRAVDAWKDRVHA